MISRASSTIAKWLLRAGAITEEDRELYEYAAYSFLFSLLPLCLVIVLGGLMGMLAEGILMILPFMLIRKFSGGFHLRSPLACLISSTLLLCAFLFMIRFVASGQHVILFSCFVAASALQVFLCSPIDNEARRLSEKEYAVFKRVARTMSVLFLLLYIILSLMPQPRFSVSVGSGVILTALLQLPCRFARRRGSC